MTDTPPAPASSAADSADAPRSQLTQAQVVWRRFRRHRAGMAGGLLLLAIGLTALFADALAPHHPFARHSNYVHAPPQTIRFLSEEGFHWRPFVYGIEVRRDLETGLKTYLPDKDERYPLRLFVRGDPYRFLGLFETNLRLLGVADDGPLFLLGTDKLGRDMLSRLLVGAQVSLTVGLFAVLFSLALGASLGMVSGYFGGWVDMIVQRLIELIFAFPSIPILMALSALIPPTWPPYLSFMGIVTVLALVGWGSLAREVRGKALAIREADFVLAARASGARDGRILRRHIFPAMYTHVIVISSLAMPSFILSESTLSFLGLGIKPPLTSWGALLAEAMNLHALYLHPWLLAPGVCILVTVLAFNFLGDGLRDAAAATIER